MEIIYGIIICSISGTIGCIMNYNIKNNLTEKNIKLQNTIEKLKYEISKKDKLLKEHNNYEILK